jgi:hypothetical protein
LGSRFTPDEYRSDLSFDHSAVAIKHHWYDQIDRFLDMVAQDRRTTAKSCPGKVDVHILSGSDEMCEPN